MLQYADGTNFSSVSVSTGYSLSAQILNCLSAFLSVMRGVTVI